MNRSLVLFFIAVACLAVGSGLHDSIFNNFLADTFHLSAEARGWLEFPREMPGFLVVAMAGALYAFSVTGVGVVGALLFCLGSLGLAFFGRQYGAMMAMMVLGSAGMHLLQPVGASVILSLSSESTRGKWMGIAGGVGTAGMVLGTGFVWLFFDKAAPAYRLGFIVVGLMAGVAALIYASMHIPQLKQPRARLVLHQRFSLYYALEFLFGARKQIFITFGPWVLIKVYGLPASSIAGLLMAAAIIGIVFRPLSGLAIDRFGERAVMMVDGVVLAVVCIGYGYALRIAGDPDLARTIACLCFVLDDLLFSLGNARSIYVARITASPQELTSTLALGVSINHIASMTIPAVAGAVWMGLGYERVFLGAAVLALSISAVSTLVPRRTLVKHIGP